MCLLNSTLHPVESCFSALGRIHASASRPFLSTTLGRWQRTKGVGAAKSEAWGLSETEWRRYRSLTESIRDSISPPTISPIEVLGIHARDGLERRRYAEAWARTMREDVDRILAFQRDPSGCYISPAATARYSNNGKRQS